jgi:hypothetical protein
MADKKTRKTKLDLDALIAALPEAAAATPPSLPVQVLVTEGKTLSKALGKASKKFVALATFDAALITRVPFLLGALDDAEHDWRDARAQAKTKQKKGGLRVEGEQLKGKLMKRLRYLHRKDEAKTAQLDDIAEGDGLADLIDDLTRLSSLTTASWAVLQKMPGVPRDAAARAGELATLLGEHQDTEDAQALQARRNQVAWLFEADQADVREAAHLLFEDEPKKLAPFVSHHHAAQAKKSRAKKSAAVGPATP